jgi:iron complex transport system substrate-binding protein
MLLACSFATVALGVGCGSSSAPSAGNGPPDAAGPETAEASFPLRVTDALDREVSLPRSPRRIISLAPRLTETLFAIGAGDRLVGRTTFCNYPPEAVAAPTVGGFSAKSVSLEQIVSLRPDLVIAIREMHAPIIQELDRLDLPVLALTADSFDELFGELELLGRATGRSGEASRLIHELRERVENVRSIAERIPADERVTAYYQVWAEPMMAAGPASYLGEMLRLCGARNVIDDVLLDAAFSGDSAERFPKISLEVLVAADPDVIVGPAIQASFFAEDSLRSRPAWSGLRAVRNGRIHLLDTDVISRCSPRLVDALEQMARALYPKHFAAPDAKPPAAEDRQRAEAKP